VSVAHDGAVQSVHVDGLTQLTVTAGADCFVRFWKFKSCMLINQLKMDAAVARAELHRERYFVEYRPYLKFCDCDLPNGPKNRPLMFTGPQLF